MKMTVILLALGLVACGGADSEGDDSAPPSDTSDTSTSGPEDTGNVEKNAACSAPTTAKNEMFAELDVNGVARNFRLVIPEADAGEKLPIFMAFHGGGEGHYSFPQQDNFLLLGEEQKVIMVNPYAKLVLPNEGAWQLNTTADSMQDINFVEAIIDDLSANYCVDEDRIYATGYSLGSMFTYELACHLNSRFAAIASHAGTMPVEPDSCVIEDEIAIMHLHGQGDSIISYNREWDWKEWDSVGTMMNIEGLISYWSEKFNCDDGTESDAGTATHLVHDGCDGGVRVEHYALRGDHEWPNNIDGTSTHDVIWNFVSEFSK